jgi:plasmid maintenance system antidote protein VapI
MLQSIMAHVKLADLLRPFGITSAEEFARRLGLNREHAKKVYAGARPISRSVAGRLKTLTNGSISIDALYALSEGSRRK